MLAGGQAPRLTLPAWFTNCPTQAARIGPYLHGGHPRRQGLYRVGLLLFNRPPVSLSKPGFRGCSLPPIAAQTGGPASLGSCASDRERQRTQDAAGDDLKKSSVEELSDERLVPAIKDVVMGA